nr:MAG TPA: hypothetical protein [Caudoviricetes sp.]
MDKINITMTEKTYNNGDALDFNARTLDIFHHDELGGAVLNLFKYGVFRGVTESSNGLHEVIYYDRRNFTEVAEIKYGGTLELTDYGRENVRKQVGFYPKLIEIDGKQYAVLECGLHLILGCPGIIWYDGKWCAPMDQLEFRDNAVWCKTVFADD